MSDDKKKGMMEKWKEKREESKKKKLINQIKKKDEMINKSKEEIKKMALELKDGKLVKMAEKTRGATPTQPVAQPTQQQPVVQVQVQPQQMQQPQPQQMQMPSQQHMAQQMQHNTMSPFDNAVQPEIPQQEFVNQPTGPTQEFSQEEAMRDVPINFAMLGGLNFQFITKLGGLKEVLTYIAESINNQEVIELGNRLINPRHIVYYEY